MTQLSSNARRLLEQASTADTPPLAARARVEHALLTRLANPAPISGSLGSSVLKTSLTAKAGLALGVGVVSLAIFSVVPSQTRESVPPEPSCEAARVSPQDVEATPALTNPSPMPNGVKLAAVDSARLTSTPHVEPVAASARSIAHPNGRSASGVNPRTTTTAVQPPHEHEPEPVRSTARSQSSDHATKPSVANAQASASTQTSPHQAQPLPPAADKFDLLTAEATSLRAVQGALRSGNGAYALELLADDMNRFAHGVLHQERSAARIQALCLVGRTQTAHREAELFIQRWPRSPLLVRVRSACR